MKLKTLVSVVVALIGCIILGFVCGSAYGAEWGSRVMGECVSVSVFMGGLMAICVIGALES